MQLFNTGMESSIVALRRAQDYWRSVQAGRDAAQVFLRWLPLGRSQATDLSLKILKQCNEAYLEIAVTEFSFALGSDYIVYLDRAGELILSVYPKSSLPKIAFRNSMNS